MGGLLQVHRLHSALLPAHRHCRVLETGALAGAKISVTHQTLDAELVSSARGGQGKTWLVYGRSERGNRVGKALRRMVTSPKAQFRWRNPESNPYIFRSEPRSTVTSNYHDVAMAMGQD